MIDFIVHKVYYIVAVIICVVFRHKMFEDIIFYRIGVIIMNFDFLRSATASSSAYRVVCGEMIIDSNMWNVRHRPRSGGCCKGRLYDR